MRKWWSHLAGLCCLLHSALTWGLPGAHAPAISTFDTRGSTVVVGYREGFSKLEFRTISYNANFSSTSGNFSAQFGAHYIALRDETGVDLAHGAGAGGVGLFSIPLSGRFDNGVPRWALDLYGGGAPAVAVSGARNFLTAPMVFGLGLSMSPAHWLTITPWVEAAPSFSLDTFIDSEGIQIEVVQRPDGSISTTPLEEAVNNSIQRRTSFDIGTRAGAMLTAHIGDTWDFNVHGEYVTFAEFFRGTPIVQAGAGLGFHWDDVVPAVLPSRLRLLHESCEDIEQRFMSCPRWHELNQAAPACPKAPDCAPSQASPQLAPPRPSPASAPPSASPPPNPAPPNPAPPGPAPPGPAPSSSPPTPTPLGPPTSSFPPPGVAPPS